MMPSRKQRMCLEELHLSVIVIVNECRTFGEPDESRGTSSRQLMWGRNPRFGVAYLLPGGCQGLLVHVG